MGTLEQFLLLWLSQRQGRDLAPRQHRVREDAQRRAAYQGMTPGILHALETSFAQWHETHDREQYETRVRQAVATLPQHAWAVRRLTEPMRQAQGYRIACELEWLHERLDPHDPGEQ